MWFVSDERDEGCVAVVNVVLEMQLWPLDILGMNELVAAHGLSHCILKIVHYLKCYALVYM